MFGGCQVEIFRPKIALHSFEESAERLCYLLSLWDSLSIKITWVGTCTGSWGPELVSF